MTERRHEQRMPPTLPVAHGPEEGSDAPGPARVTRETQDLAALPLPEALRLLGSTETGLTTPAAAALLETVGPNQIEQTKQKGLLRAFAQRFTNPLVAILVFAALVSAFTGDVPSFVIIEVIVLMSVILDVTQERQAQNAAQALRTQISLSARVLRDSRAVDIPATEIVPGDIAFLKAGDLVPADCRLIECRDLYVDEALLTGESYPAEKEVAPPSTDRPPAAAVPRNIVFMGSSVVSGTAKALVLGTWTRPMPLFRRLFTVTGKFRWCRAPARMPGERART